MKTMLPQRARPGAGCALCCFGTAGLILDMLVSVLSPIQMIIKNLSA